MSEFKKIFLQPECCVEDQDVGRMWCQDAINDCEEGNAWTEYLLASEVNQRIAELEKALATSFEFLSMSSTAEYLFYENHKHLIKDQG
jgi:hypothetical protein